MKQLLKFACVLLLTGAVLIAQNSDVVSNDDVARAAAIRLFKSLTDEQKSATLREFSDRDRYNETFPATKRNGLPVSKMAPEQKMLLDEVIAGMTSPQGAKIAHEIWRQDRGSWLNFFGSPEPGKPFAVRLALHHLTLIYAEFGTNSEVEFGPILMGGNPVGTLYDEEEKIFLDLRQALTAEEQKLVLTKLGGSGSFLSTTAGMKIGDLTEKPRALARRLLEQRLGYFSKDRAKRFETQVRADGGLDSLRIAISGDAEKGHLSGGNYTWKIGNERILVDWQTAGKNHLHLTVKVKNKG